MKLFPIAGIVYVAFGFLTTTTNGAPFPSNAIVTERKASEAEALSIADNGVASSLVRRRLSQPHNPTVTHGDSNSNSDSELDRLNIDNAPGPGRPTTPPTNSDFRVPEDRFEALVWFSNERPSADSTQLGPVAANVYPDAYGRITSVVSRSRAGIPPCNSVKYLERLTMGHHRFHFQFFRIPHDTGTPVAIGGPFRDADSLPPLEIPRDRHDLYEPQVWFTDTGRQRGPDSEVRLSIRATGLSVSNANHVYNGMSSSMSLARNRFRIRLRDSSEVIPVFREKWSEGDRQFHWQVFERDRNGNLVAMGDNGPFTADLLATDAPPHTGGNSGAA
ncbi:hypothetical protein EV361DRAFT_593673 [Lentinula raphanica]|nr:hypothetical protein EV361DRAFT_593673 [Lentinula raphanica]